MSELENYWNQQPLVSNVKTKTSSARKPRKSQGQHNYRLIDPNTLRGVPATNGAQADDPRKRHKLAAIRKPRTHAIALTDTLVTRADGTQYIILRTSRHTTRKITKERTAAVVHKMTAADMAPIQNYEGDN